MGNKTNHPHRVSAEGQWNGLDVIGRKEMILNHQDLFLSLGLTTQDEIDRMRFSSDSDIEYIACRDEDMICKEIKINHDFDSQPMPIQFRTALQAVFL